MDYILCAIIGGMLVEAIAFLINTKRGNKNLGRPAQLEDIVKPGGTFEIIKVVELRLLFESKIIIRDPNNQSLMRIVEVCGLTWDGTLKDLQEGSMYQLELTQDLRTKEVQKRINLVREPVTSSASYPSDRVMSRGGVLEYRRYR